MANTRKTTSTKDQSYDGFSEDERAAMKDRAKELKAAKVKVIPRSPCWRRSPPCRRRSA